MIQHRDIEQFPRRDQLLRYCSVIGRWCRITRRVIVAKNDRRRPCYDCVDEHLSRMHERLPDTAGIPSSDLAELVQQLSDQMRNAAAELQFELAARLRDEISELKKELRQMMEATK